MIAYLLMRKIISLFIIMFLGYFLVKIRILRSSDSQVLSKLVLYLMLPAVILTSFQVEYTSEIRMQFLLAFAGAVLAHLVFFIAVIVIRKATPLDPVELTSIFYPNSANLIAPLVTSILGPEWLIFSSAFIFVQFLMLFSHGMTVLSGNPKFDLKKIVTNINMISIFVGIILFFSRIRFPGPVKDACDSLASAVGTLSMLVVGMLIANMDLRKAFLYPRIWFITFLRLIVLPILTLLVFRYSGIAGLIPNGKEILLIPFLASIAPAASSITQMSQVYGRNADYAGSISILTTICCIVTMPLMVFLYQL